MHEVQERLQKEETSLLYTRMKSSLKGFAPVIVALVIILILAGVRAYTTGKFAFDGRWPDVAGGMYDKPVMKDGVRYVVPPDEVYENGLGKDGIPALNEPSYTTVAVADESLADDVYGISVEVNGDYRFYSFQILNWHEIVNDRFGDTNLLISYSPLCGSAVVYDRNIFDDKVADWNLNGEPITFGDAGYVYNDCAILYGGPEDNLWNQATGELIAGDMAGEIALHRYASEVVSWLSFKADHPDGEVLSVDTGFARDYRHHPYGSYDTSDSYLFPVNATTTRLSAKEPVWDVVVQKGVVINNVLVPEDVHVGLTTKLVAFMKDLNITVGDTSYAAFLDGTAVHLFIARDDSGSALTFVKEAGVITDKETGSTWNAKGLATKGELKGTQLMEDPSSARYFAFSYVSQYPDAIMPGADVFDAAVAASATVNADNGAEITIE